jgi:hypothetical protein
MRFESIDDMKSLTSFCFTRHRFPTYTSHQTRLQFYIKLHTYLWYKFLLLVLLHIPHTHPPFTRHLQVSCNIITMPQSPSPARTFSPLTHSRNSAASTTLTTPAPSPTYTFHWICPRSSCHTCPTRSVPFATAPPRQFEDYEDQQQLHLEYEYEEIGELVLPSWHAETQTNRRRGFGLYCAV